MITQIMKKIIFTTETLTIPLYISVDIVHTVSESLLVDAYDSHFNTKN